MITTTKTPITKVITGKVRLSYAHVWKPVAINGDGEPKYSACLLIPKNDKETVQKIKLAVEAAIKEGVARKWGGKSPVNLKLPLRDGDAERPDQVEYKGMYFVNASSRQAPGIVDKNRQEILDSTEVYSGSYARVSINFYSFDNHGNRGVACGLNNIQKLENGESLGGKSRAEDDFEEYDDDDPLN